MRGVDIYRYQTVTDYRALARSVRFAYVKLTDGRGPAVVRGDSQVNGCRAAEIPVGGYHYAQPGDARQQAQVFISELRRLRATGLAPMLDLEEAALRPAARDFGLAFCWELVRAGYRPGVYLSASWAGELRPDRWGIPGLVIWIAAYGGNDGAPYNPDLDPAKVRRYYPGRYDIHQHTSRAAVPGIRGEVDLNWSLTGIPKNTATQEENDMQLNDKVNWDEINKLGPDYLGHKILGIWQNSVATRQIVTAHSAAINALAKLIAADDANDLTEDQIREAVREEIAVVDVDVTVTGQASTQGGGQ